MYNITIGKESIICHNDHNEIPQHFESHALFVVGGFDRFLLVGQLYMRALTRKIN